jgi:hypothetical protein
MTLFILMIFLVMGTSYSLEIAGYSPAFRNKKFFNLNGASLKFAATHVNHLHSISQDISKLLNSFI